MSRWLYWCLPLGVGILAIALLNGPARSQGPNKIIGNTPFPTNNPMFSGAKPPVDEDEGTDEPASKLENLIQRAGLKFQRKAITLGDGSKAFVYGMKFKSDQGKVVVVMATEINALKDEGGQPVKVAKVWSVLGPLPEGRAATTFLRKACDFNLDMNVGKVATDKESVFYVSEFWLRTGDVQTLKDHVGYAYSAPQSLPRILGLKAASDEEEGEGFKTPFGLLRQP